MAGERVLGPAEEASEAWLEVSPGLLLRRLATGNFVGDINAMATLAGDAAFRVSLLSLGDLEASGEVTFTLVIEAAGLLVTPFLLTLMGVTRVFLGLTKPSWSKRLRCTDALLLDFLEAVLVIGGVMVLGVLGVFGSCKESKNMSKVKN